MFGEGEGWRAFVILFNDLVDLVILVILVVLFNDLAGFWAQNFAVYIGKAQNHAKMAKIAETEPKQNKTKQTPFFRNFETQNFTVFTTDLVIVVAK